MRPVRAAALKCRRALGAGGGGEGSEVRCACGRVTKSLAGLSSHRRSCNMVKRLLIQPVSSTEHNTISSTIGLAEEQSVLSHTCRSSHIDNLNSINAVTFNKTDLINDNALDMLSSSVKDFSCANSVKNVSNCYDIANAQSSGSLQPLPGIYLPKTVKQWEEMN